MNIYSKYFLSGESYNIDDKFIQINLNYNTSRDYLIDEYMIKNNTNETFVNNFTIYVLNMDKYKNFWYNKDEKEISKYKYLIMLDLPKEELAILSKTDKVVSSYMDRLNTINEDPRFQSYMSAEEDDRKILNSIKHEYFDKGKEKGVEQGTNSRNIAIAKKMKEKGYSEKEIQDIIGLTIKEY